MVSNKTILFLRNYLNIRGNMTSKFIKSIFKQSCRKGLDNFDWAFVLIFIWNEFNNYEFLFFYKASVVSVIQWSLGNPEESFILFIRIIWRSVWNLVFSSNFFKDFFNLRANTFRLSLLSFEWGLWNFLEACLGNISLS